MLQWTAVWIVAWYYGLDTGRLVASQWFPVLSHCLIRSTLKNCTRWMSWYSCVDYQWRETDVTRHGFSSCIKLEPWWFFQVVESPTKYFILSQIPRLSGWLYARLNCGQSVRVCQYRHCRFCYRWWLHMSRLFSIYNNSATTNSSSCLNLSSVVNLSCAVFHSQLKTYFFSNSFFSLVFLSLLDWSHGIVTARLEVCGNCNMSKHSKLSQFSWLLGVP